MPAPSQVAFGDVGNRHELVQRAVPAADTEGPGGFFLHLDLEVHLVGLHLFGQELDRFKIVEVGQSLVAPFHRHRVGDFLFVDPELTADDVVPGLVVAGDLDLPDPNEVPFLDVEGDRGGLRLRVRGDRGADIRKGIPPYPIQLSQSGHLLANLGALEDFPRFDLHPRFQLRLLVNRVPPEPDLSDGVRVPFHDHEGDREPFLVFSQLDDRQTHLDVEVAFVQVHFLDALHIVAQLLALENARIRKNRGEAAQEDAVKRDPFAGGDQLEHVFLLHDLHAIKSDGLDPGPLPFLDEEGEPLSILLQRQNDRDHLRVVVPVLLIGQPNPLGAFLGLLLVQKGLTPDGDLLLQLILAEVLVPVKHNLGDERLLPNHEHHGHPPDDRISLDPHVLKEAHLVDQSDLSPDGLPRVGIIHLEREAAADGRLLDALVSPHFDGLDLLDASLGMQTAHGRNQQRDGHRDDEKN